MLPKPAWKPSPQAAVQCVIGFPPSRRGCGCRRCREAAPRSYLGATDLCTKALGVGGRCGGAHQAAGHRIGTASHGRRSCMWLRMHFEGRQLLMPVRHRRKWPLFSWAFLTALGGHSTFGLGFLSLAIIRDLCTSVVVVVVRIRSRNL